MPSFQYVGTRPEHIVGIPAGDISEPAYDALPWDLQQAVLLNKGSDGSPLYVERMDRATVREFNANMREGQEPDHDEVVEPTPEPATEPAVPAETPAEEGGTA